MTLLNTRKLTTTAVVPTERRRTYIIPIARPETAQPLMNIAAALLQGQRGRIVLLFVVTDNDALAAHKIAELGAIVETAYHEARNCIIEPKIHRADSVVDGILEVAERNKADMILLGLSYAVRGQVELGPVVDGVVERAHCDVGVYRSPGYPMVERVVIPVGGSIASRVTLEIGDSLAQGLNLPCESLHVYSSGTSSDARGHMDDLLTIVPEPDRVGVNLVQGVNEANSVLSWATEYDLMVIGFSQRNPLHKWLYGDTAQRILDRARGPVLMVSRAMDNATVQALAKRRLSFLRPLLSETEQEHIVWLAKDTVMPTLDYGVLLVIAALIASFGLLLSSSAVVIGAMLVAPLMQPIIALGIGLCTARLNLMRKAAVTIALSVSVVLALGYVVGLVIAPPGPTSEILARAYPSLLDAGVALTAGFIGAYATARKDIPAALAGVAIAAALVPPICSVGISIALGEPRLAIGAMLLFITNLVCIMLVVAVVFFWMGMRPTRLDSGSRRRRYGLLLASCMCALLILGGVLNYTQQPTVERISETRLATVFDPAEIVNLRIHQEEPLLVIATLRTPSPLEPEMVKMAEVMLTEDLGSPVRLRLLVQQVIDSGWDDVP